MLGGVPSGGARAAPTTTHPADHVFEIILEPEQRFNIDIPIGARVRLVGLSGAGASRNGTTAEVARFLPAGCLEGAAVDEAHYELRDVAAGNDGDVGASTRVIAARHVQLALEDADADATIARLLERMLAQQEAREFHLGLPPNALVQLVGHVPRAPPPAAPEAAAASAGEAPAAGPAPLLRWIGQLAGHAVTALTRDGRRRPPLTGELARTVGEYDNARRGGYLVRGKTAVATMSRYDTTSVDECLSTILARSPSSRTSGELERLRENHAHGWGDGRR